MLRITVETKPTEQMWILQGRLIRPWAAELRVRQLSPLRNRDSKA